MTTTESEARNEDDPPTHPTPPLASALPAAKAEEAAAGGDVVITVKDDDGDGKEARVDVAEEEGKEEEADEYVCRICHLSPDRELDEGLELIVIGCGCKNELGTAHRHCAETWFRLKGNRCCEICGSNAKNITGDVDDSFIPEWHESIPPPSNIEPRNSSERVGCLGGKPFCNFLMACLVIAFLFPWFYRLSMF